MASFFNLRLDTTAPAGLALLINGGAQYTTSVNVSLGITVTDADTTGYQMKVWGINGVTSESEATWETFAATKAVQLTSEDGLKTVNCKVRDNVGNECTAVSASITLDSSVPAVTITGPDKTVISKKTGFDVASFSFTVDVAFVEYKVKVVTNSSSIESAGEIIGATNGSTNMAATGEFAANTPINCTINGADLEAASAGDGTKVIKVFAKNAAGNWSVA